MPTKRKRVTRGRNGSLSMNSFRFHHLLCFMSGWRPPQNEFELSRSRWQTWQEFMADWLEIRDEFLASEAFQRAHPIFAEQILKTFGVKGPPDDATYDDVHNAFEARDDAVVAELLGDLEIGRG